MDIHVKIILYKKYPLWLKQSLNCKSGSWQNTLGKYHFVLTLLNTVVKQQAHYCLLSERYQDPGHIFCYILILYKMFWEQCMSQQYTLTWIIPLYSFCGKSIYKCHTPARRKTTDICRTVGDCQVSAVCKDTIYGPFTILATTTVNHI